MKSIYFYIVITYFLMYSCIPPVQEYEPLNCEEPKPECIITKWDGLPIDTSKSLEKIQGYYTSIEKVYQLDKSYNEYALAFKDKETAFLTYKYGDDQGMREVLLVEDNSFSLKDEFDLLSGHEGAATIKDGEFYFSAIPNSLDMNKINYYSNKPYNSDGYLRIPTEQMIGRSRLFMADLKGEIPVQPRISELSMMLNDFEWESHPAFSPDGKVLFFSSTREGGMGSADIWYVVKQANGSWSEPKNAGPEINSPCDEFTPFVTADGKTLLFSSNGFETVGGHDIFEIQIEDEFWKDHNRIALKERKNMRPPLNTTANEMFPSTPFDMDSILYYASDQNGGQYDIFVKRKVQLRELEIGSRKKDGPIENVKIDIPEEDELVEFNDIPVLPKDTTQNIEVAVVDPPELDPLVFDPPELVIEGVVIAENTGKPTVADVKVKDLLEDKVTQSTKTDQQGNFKLSVKKKNDIEVIAENEDNFFQSTVITKEEMAKEKVIKTDFKLPVELTLRINFPYDVFDKPYEYTLDSLGVESHKTWHGELDNVAENIKMSLDRIDKIILVGHTDYIASEQYNKKLGLNRVIFVVDQLEKRGIPREKMKYSSAGESELLPKRASEDDEIYRKRLRRVTINKIYKD